jgi:hypothetical protein
LTADAPPDRSAGTAVIIASVAAGRNVLNASAINAKPRNSGQYDDVRVIVEMISDATAITAVPADTMTRVPNRRINRGARGTTRKLTTVIGTDVATAACSGR